MAAITVRYDCGHGDNRAGGKRTVTLRADEFIGRFLRHVLPTGFTRLRHYGILASGHKRE